MDNNFENDYSIDNAFENENAAAQDGTAAEELNVEANVTAETDEPVYQPVGQTEEPVYQPTEEPVAEQAAEPVYGGYDYAPVYSNTYDEPPRAEDHFESEEQYRIYPADMMTVSNAASADENVRTAKPKKNKKKFSLLQLVASILITALTCGVFMNFLLDMKLNRKLDSLSTTTYTDSGDGKLVNISTETSPVAAVAEKVADSVVGIRVTTTGAPTFFSTGESVGEGSGVVYTQDGYIITNYHVISSAVQKTQPSRSQVDDFFSYFFGQQQGGGQTQITSKIEVFLNGDTETAYEGEIIGYNASVDLAVLKIDKTGLRPMEIGDSDSLTVGDVAIAIGNPGGLDFMGSVSQGIISGLNRTLVTESGTETSLIQTDAAINPGNSGGALCDAAGRLIGVNNSKMAGSNYEGMGFSIPVNTVVEVCNGIIDNKDKPQPYLGISASTEYTADVLKQYGLPEGVLVASCVSGSPAEEAGIQAYDIITEINGVAVTSYEQLTNEKNNYSVGDTISLRVYRNGNYFTLDVTLGATY